MIRGGFVNIPKEELNIIFFHEGLKKHMTPEEIDSPMYKEVTFDEYMKKDIGLNFLKEKILSKGFTIEAVYPIYYQRWELDEWGAIAVKGGKRYAVETDYGQLRFIELKEGYPKVKTMEILEIGE